MNKIEKTPENKARFFALHWGQELHTDECYKDDPLFLVDPENTYGWLELTPLSQINPSHAMIIGKLFQPLLSLPKVTEYHGKLFCRRLLGSEYGNSPDNNYRPYKAQQAVDYLRSKGYALPWMGLSVEDLINYGWIKLREANHG